MQTSFRWLHIKKEMWRASYSSVVRQQVVGTASKHKHLTIRTGARRVPQPEGAKANIIHILVSLRRTYEFTVTRGDYLGLSVWLCLKGFHSFLLTQYSQASPGGEKRVAEVNLRHLICCCLWLSLTHSVSLCLWWNLQTGRCGLMTQEWRSAKNGPRDPAGERSYSEAEREQRWNMDEH